MLDFGKAWAKMVKGVTTEETREREKICKSCPSLGEAVGVKVCMRCGCPIKAKIHDKCPIDKW